MKFNLSTNETDLLLKYLTGKTSANDSGLWLPAWMHMRDTAEIAVRIARHSLPVSTQNFLKEQIGETKFYKYIKLHALLHDIGKYTYKFQIRILNSLPEIRSKIEELIDCSVRISSDSFLHSLASQNILELYGFPLSTSVIAGAHHGEPLVDFRHLNMTCEPKSYWGKNEALFKSVWQAWIKYALRESGFDSPSEVPSVDQSAQLLLSGLVVEADWISSKTDYFPLIPTDIIPDFGVYPPKRADAAWKSFDASAPWNISTYSCDDAVFSRRFNGITPNSIQKEFVDICGRNQGKGGIYILEAPMGCGKTEAALMGAELLASINNSGGIFFGLPTQATANGIFDRIVPWAENLPDNERNSVKLAHQAAELNDLYRAIRDKSYKEDDVANNLYVHKWLSGKKQTLLSNFVVGTIDQLLLAGLSQKYAMLRHLGLAGKVVVIDEVHSYDAYMNVFLDSVLHLLGSFRTPVILLSATLTGKRRAELINAYANVNSGKKAALEEWAATKDYPLVTYCEPAVDPKDVKSLAIPYNGKQKHIKIKRISEDGIVESLKEKLKDGGCACIICNTVARAQRFAALIKEALPDSYEIIYHSQFILEHRTAIENELTACTGKKSTAESRYSRKTIVIGTQTLEQSLDIDFDFLITDLCPMDVLLQRIGRLFRHDRKRNSVFTEPCCMVLDYSDEYSEIYEKWTLEMVEKLLPDFITTPDDISPLVQDAYDTNSCPEGNKYLINEEKMRSKAALIGIKAPSNKEGLTIAGMFTRKTSPENDDNAMAAVRCGVNSIPVYVMIYDGSDNIRFINDSHDPVSRPHAPSYEEALLIKKQKINLPYTLSVGKTADEIINRLEEMNAAIIPEWQNSNELKGELILLLDEKNEVSFEKYKMKYHPLLGMKTEKIDG